MRLAATRKKQPLDLPMEWTHGKHRVAYAEIALRDDQADYAACFLHRSATYLMAVAMKDAIRAAIHNPKASTDSDIVGAYQISRLIRNAFAHAPFAPTWSIDEDCRDKRFAVRDLIVVDTTDLHGRGFDRWHYGGPLALLRLSRFVRVEILGHKPPPRKLVPTPTSRIYQQGDLILEKVESLPAGAVPVENAVRPGGGIDLGGEHVLYPSADTKDEGE